MNENIAKAIKQAQDLVEASEIKREFSLAAYKVVLAHLLRVGTATSRLPVTATAPMASAATHVAWSALVEEKQPASIYQLIALAVDYLSGKNTGDQKEMSFVTKKDLVEFLEKECFNHISRKHFNKFGQAISHASKTYGYIRSIKRGSYTVTPFGRKMIHNLPEQLPPTATR